uniref:Si:dkey-28n18.9 n=1 Tax=Oryzias melastigma TaxID=30732 RepID=A0A3B3E034_ORYME
MEKVKGASSFLSVQVHNIKVTEVLQDGDSLTFIIVSQKMSGTGEFHVDRTYEDFEWLQQHLFSQEDVPGIQGVIFPPLPARLQVNASSKTLRHLGFLGLGEWQPYCKALETFLRQVAAHSILSKNRAVEIFLTSSDPPGRQKVKKNIFNRLSQAVEEMRKEGHKDVDDFFQTKRDHNFLLTGYTKMAAEVSESSVCLEIAVACGHFSTALHLCMEQGENPEKNIRLTSMSVFLFKIKEMLFRRTCKLVELQNATKNAEKAKPVKKAMEEAKKATETEFRQICEVAKKEVSLHVCLQICRSRFCISFLCHR